jgi:hypothetical protein
MNYLELVNETLSELDTPTIATLTGATGLPRRVMRWVNRIIFDIFNRSNDWSFREGDGFLNTVAGVDTYDLPFEWVDPDSLKSVILQATNIPLHFMDYEDLDRSRSGMPLCYSVFKNQLILSPKPNGVFTIKYTYQVKPKNLVLDTDQPYIPEKWHYVIVDGAVYRAKLFLNDEDFRDQQALYEQGIKLMQAHNRDQLGRETGMEMEAGWIDEHYW